jgi:hypothetical protein
MHGNYACMVAIVASSESVEVVICVDVLILCYQFPIVTFRSRISQYRICFPSGLPAPD